MRVIIRTAYYESTIGLANQIKKYNIECIYCAKSFISYFNQKEDDILIFNPCFIKRDFDKLPDKIINKMIIYNYEPAKTVIDIINKFLNKYKLFQFWDFSYRNLELFKIYNIFPDIKKVYIPFGYYPDYEKLFKLNENNIIDNKKYNKNIDVLFYGHINSNKKKYYEQLKDKVNIVFRNDLMGPKKNKFIKECKLFLCIPSSITSNSLHKLSYLISNKCFIIAEKCQDTKINDELSQFFPVVKGTQFKQTVLDTLKLSQKELDYRANSAYEWFKNEYNMDKFITQELIDSFY